MIDFVIYIVSAFIVLFTYFAFFYKINWTRDRTKGNDWQTSLLFKYKMVRSIPIKELPPVYPNGWFGLLESRELKKSQVKHIAALGQNFAVFRTESGVACVLDAFCPHLGANMGESGAVRGEELECLFHCWRFSGETGKCTTIPYSKNVPESIKAKVWESIEVNNLIFVWYHAEKARPDWYPQPIENIHNGKCTYQGRNEFYANCHIQEILENGSDLAHLNALHGPAMAPSSFFSKIMRHKWSNITWTTKGYTIEKESKYNNEENGNEKHQTEVSLEHNLVLFNKYHLMNLTVIAKQIGPGYTIVFMKTTFGILSILETVTPIAPLVLKITHNAYSNFLMSPFFKIVLICESIMFNRDVEIWNHKRYLQNPKLVKEDRYIKLFRKWFKQFYSENSPTYESCRDTLEW